MTRADKLKATSDPSCEATRVIKKNCKPGKSKDKSAKEQRKNKDKGNLANPTKNIKHIIHIPI